MGQFDVFVRLAKYKPTTEKTSTENFFTELVAHLLEQEETIRGSFTRLLLREPNQLPTTDFCVKTQELTRSRRAALSGLLLDIVLKWHNGYLLILENKVDSDLSTEQLQNYLDYAEDFGQAKVAVITKNVQSAAHSCKHPLFLGQFLWSDFSQQWYNERDVSNRYLLESVLEFMRSQNMGPAENFIEEELTALHRLLAFEGKMRIVVEHLDRRIDQQGPFDVPPELTRRHSIGAGPCRGTGWCAPSDKTPSACNFWYFLGFHYKSSESYYLKPLEVGEPECVTFIGMWPASGTVARLRDALTPACKELVAAGFDFVESTGGSFPAACRVRL